MKPRDRIRFLREIDNLMELVPYLHSDLDAVSYIFSTPELYSPQIIKWANQYVDEEFNTKVGDTYGLSTQTDAPP